MILRIEFIDTETITVYKKLHCERHRYIFYGILKLEVTFNIISILLLYMNEYVYTGSLISKKCCFWINIISLICANERTPLQLNVKSLMGDWLPLMPGLFPWYTPQKVNNVFTGSLWLEMHLYISFMLCMLPSANRLMWRTMWGYIPSSIWFLPYSIIVSTLLMFYEKRLCICVFMKL